VNKNYLLIGVAAIGLVLVWTLTRPNELDEKTNAGDGTAINAGDSAAEPSVLLSNSGSSDTIESTPQPDSVSNENPKTVISPFAVTNEAQTTNADDIGSASLAENSTAQNSSGNNTLSTSVPDDEGSDEVLRDIDVPTSYPASDAAKYFIPKEERRSGNLGGPPPPPSAGASQLGVPPTGNSVFIAPTAPGQ